MIISGLAGSNEGEETPRPPGSAITGNIEHWAEVKKISVTKRMQKQGPKNHLRTVLPQLCCSK